MKYIFCMKCLLFLFHYILLANVSVSAQSSYEKTGKKEIKKWFNSQVWKKGLGLIPHKSINKYEFYRQYEINGIWWDKAFEYLKSNDLENLQPGRYVIDSGNVVAYVSEAQQQNINLVKWETHQKFNDLQYIIEGKAEMGITPRSGSNASINVLCDDKSDIQFYTVKGGKYYNAEPGTFFIFSPQEIHRPTLKIEGYDVIKKILIKVRVPGEVN